MAKKTTRKTAPSDENERLLNILEHVLVPKHELCSETEKKQILARYGVQPFQLPRILITDPAIQHLGAKEDDLIKITRKSATAGTTTFYRIVTLE